MPDEVMLSEAMAAAQRADKEERLAVEEARLRRTVRVPTKNAAVVASLRQMLQPATLFGEDVMARRDRLRDIVAWKMARGLPVELVDEESVQTTAGRAAQTLKQRRDGGQRLLSARLQIAHFSLKRAAERLERARSRSSIVVDAAQRSRFFTRMRWYHSFTNISSEIGAPRPLSSIRIAPDSQTIATSSWSGSIELWSLTNPQRVPTRLSGHLERTIDLAFHPQSTLTLSPSLPNLISSSADRTCRVWSLTSTDPLASLQGHSDRLSRVAFHPSGDYFASTSFDTTWRLWDLNTCKTILCQDGHSRATYAVAFHPDGSLVAVGDVAGHGRVSDLRSGAAVMQLAGHVKHVLGCDFAANGYHLATCSADNTVRVWDLRKNSCLNTLPAHLNLVSDVRYGKQNDVLVTASYDKTVRLWSARDFTKLVTLKGHEDKVVRADISPDGKYVVSCSFDRTWKVWTSEDKALEQQFETAQGEDEAMQISA